VEKGPNPKSGQATKPISLTNAKDNVDDDEDDDTSTGCEDDYVWWYARPGVPKSVGDY
jgi:hypothetical protein